MAKRKPGWSTFGEQFDLMTPEKQRSLYELLKKRGESFEAFVAGLHRPKARKGNR